MGVCSVTDCGRDVYGRGLCNKHYIRLTRTGTTDDGPFAQEPLEKRFWKKVATGKLNECWEWQGAISKNGYGVIGVNGKNQSAHRISYELNKGPIPDGMHVLHACDNRKCVNPSHLRAGTGSENIQEAFDKGRKKNPNLSGEQNPRSRLSLVQVNFIKAHPELMHTELAALFGVSPNTIRGVRIGRTWK